MLDDLYYDTYRRYKVGTRAVVQWLAKTAGYEFQVTEQVVRPTTAKPKKQDTVKEIEVPPGVLPDLAKDIVNSTPSLDIPRHILVTLDSVISARKECGRLHQPKANAPTEQATLRSNDSHRHFLNILEEVYSILRAASHGTVESKHTLNRYQPDEDVTFNRFGSLALDDSEEPCFEEIPVAITTSEDEETPVTNFELALPERTNAEESRFAGYCFLEDWYRIRMYVRTLWKKYSEREVSLTSASTTTNLALDSVERLHRQLCDHFSEYRDYLALDDLIMRNPRFSNFGIDEVISFGSLDDEWGDPSELTIPLPGREVYAVLRHFKQAYQKGIFKDFPPEAAVFGWSERCANGLAFRIPDEILTILIRFIPDMVAFVCVLDTTNAPIDQLTSYVFDFQRCHQITVPLVLACEIFVDIFFEAKGHISHPFEQLQQSAARARLAIKKYQIHTKVLKCDQATTLTHQTMAQLEPFIDRLVDQDAVHEFRSAHVRPKRETKEPYSLLKHHPLLCGMLRYHIDRNVYYLGLRVCNEWASAMSVIHLYNAVRVTGHLSQPWPDLDTITRFYGPSHLFVGNPPTSNEDFNNRLNLVQGITPSTISRERRKKGAITEPEVIITMKTDRAAVRQLEVRLPVLTVMRKRYKAAGKTNSAVVLSAAEKALESLAQYRAELPQEMRSTLQDWERTRSLKPASLLELIQHSVQIEDYELHFDYFEINRRCLELCRRLRDFMHEHCGNNPWDHLYMQNSRLHSITQMIFYFAEPNKVLVSRQEDDTLKQIFPFQVAAERIHDLIQREGDKESVKAKALC